MILSRTPNLEIHLSTSAMSRRNTATCKGCVPPKSVFVSNARPPFAERTEHRVRQPTFVYRYDGLYEFQVEWIYRRIVRLAVVLIGCEFRKCRCWPRVEKWRIDFLKAVSGLYEGTH